MCVPFILLCYHIFYNYFHVYVSKFNINLTQFWYVYKKYRLSIWKFNENNLILYSDLLKMMIDAARPNMAHQNCLFIYLIKTVVHTESSESFTSKSGFKHHNVCILWWSNQHGKQKIPGNLIEQWICSWFLPLYFWILSFLVSILFQNRMEIVTLRFYRICISQRIQCLTSQQLLFFFLLRETDDN